MYTISEMSSMSKSSLASAELSPCSIVESVSDTNLIGPLSLSINFPSDQTFYDCDTKFIIRLFPKIVKSLFPQTKQNCTGKSLTK